MKALDIILSIGVLGILGAFLYIGKKLQVLEDLHQTTHKIKTNVKVISDYLTSEENNFDHSELQTYSPYQLTEKGKKLIADIGFDNIFEKHKKDFFDCINSQDPKLKYDVEKLAIKAVSTLYNKDYMSFLKVYFYNNPKRTIKNTAPTLGIYVRDKYLAEHPEITE